MNKLTQDIMDRCGCSKAVALKIQDQVENALDLSECSWEALYSVIDCHWASIKGSVPRAEDVAAAKADIYNDHVKCGEV
jgi:hypothetical protein